MNGPSATPFGAGAPVARCARCGARMGRDDQWCTLCLAVPGADAPDDLGRDTAAAADAGAPHAERDPEPDPEESAADEFARAADRMIERLAQTDSGLRLSGRLTSLKPLVGLDGGGQLMAGAVGAAVVGTVLLILMTLGGLFT